MDFTAYDYAAVIAYFASVLFLGFYFGRKEKSENFIEYLLAGRKLTLPLFVGTLVATWYGNILGAGEFVYRSGLLAWVCFAFPYYIAAVVFALFFAKKIRASEYETIPEQIKANYGKAAGFVSSFIVLIITLPAAYALSLGAMIQIFGGWSQTTSILAGAVLSLIYLYFGGFKSDVATNALQFVFMYVGFGLLVYFSIKTYGGIGEIWRDLPPSHRSPTGGAGWQYILAWFIVATQTFVDPGFHQRCAAAKTPEIARRGILISAALWTIFDAMTLTAGLYAKARFNLSNPLMAFPVLGNATLPPFFKGIFVSALLATIMSTLDSYAFISAATIGRDILSPLKTKIKALGKFSEKKLVQIGLLIASFLSVGLAIALPSAIDLIYKTSSIAIPGLLGPTALTYFDNYKISGKAALTVMLVSSGVSALWTLFKSLAESVPLFGGPFFAVEPMIPGIVVSLALIFIFVKREKAIYERP